MRVVFACMRKEGRRVCVCMRKGGEGGLIDTIILLPPMQSEGIPGTVVGQCNCKSNVIGQTCDTCRPNFFNLSASNPEGCSACDCNTAGTFEGSSACDTTSGQCFCKNNVGGLACSMCVPGTTGLSESNPLGCSDCECDSTGSTSLICDAETGDCTCKLGVGGKSCNQCLDGFFGFSESGCQPCSCHPVGAQSDTCDSETGNCTCKANVVGTKCDSCADSFYDISSSCVPCDCTSEGTVNGSGTCDKETGQCPCKDGVQGLTCGTCKSGLTNLTADDPNGCSPCDCFVPNTNTSSGEELCDPDTSQCNCLPFATDLSCDTCLDGYFETLAGCVFCDCDPTGSVNGTCDTLSGECECLNDGIGGSDCSDCLPGFFGFPR